MNDYSKFLQLHQRGKPLIIANVWNVKSAKLVEQQGFEAIATSSGAISDSLGYEDGEKIPFSELLYIVQRIKACTQIPLSVDMEKGYGKDINQLTANVHRLIDAGVVGINLEDSEGEDIYLKKLSSIRNYVEKNNLQLFINARTDGFMLKVDSPVETTIRRAGLYKDAGADGLFVISLSDPLIIKEIASSATLPLNVVAVPAISSFSTLAACGVRRISMAVFLYRATYNQLARMVSEVHANQSTKGLF